MQLQRFHSELDAERVATLHNADALPRVSDQLASEWEAQQAFKADARGQGQHIIDRFASEKALLEAEVQRAYGIAQLVGQRYSEECR